MDLMLLDPRTKLAKGNTPYHLSVEVAGISQCESLRHEGVTDASGGPQVFVRTPNQIDTRGLRFVEWIGGGDKGVSKRLMYEPGTSSERPVVNTEYVITNCRGHRYEGISDEHGDTVWASDNDENCETDISLFRRVP